MNTNLLSDIELLDYLEKFSDDPLILRLVKMQTPHADVLSDLICAGADPEDFCFDNCYSISEYLHNLNNEIEYLNNELLDAQSEAHRLKARTVVDLLSELREQIKSADDDNRLIRRELHTANEQRVDAQKKLKMWSTLCEKPTGYT
jgi:hypothetical protein